MQTEKEKVDEVAKKAEKANTTAQTKDQQEAIETVCTRMKAMRDADSRTEAETRWEEGDKQYSLFIEAKDTDDYRSNIKKPIAFAIIETEMQEIAHAQQRPGVKPRETSDEPSTFFVNDTLKYSFDIGDFDYELLRTKMESKIRGTGWLYEYLREDVRSVKKLKLTRKDGEVTEEYVSEKRVDFDDPYAEYVPNELIFIDPSANHIKKARDGIRRELLDINEFRRIYQGKRGFFDIELVKAGGDTSWPTYYEQPKDATDQLVEVLHYYNRALDLYYVVANGVIVRMGPNPLPHKELPFIPFYRYKKPNEFYGYGIPWIIRSLVEERNTSANMRIDYQHMGLNKQFFYDEMIDLDEEDLITRPMGGIPINPQGKSIDQVIRWIEYGDVKASTYREDEMLVQDTQRAVGMDDRMQGVNVGGTATEAAINKESAMKRIAANERMCEIDSLVRLGRLRLEDIRFLYPIPKIQRIVEKDGGESAVKAARTIRVEGREYSLDEAGNLMMNKLADGKKYSFFEINGKTSKFLGGEYDIVVEASSKAEVSKPVKQAKITEMFDRLTQNPIIMNALNPTSAAKRYITINDEDPEVWLKEKDAADEDMQRFAQEELKVMAAGFPLPPTPGATEAHVMEEMNFAKTAAFEQLDPSLQEVITAHIMAEAGKMSVPGTAGGLPTMPEGGNMSPNAASQMKPPAQGMKETMPGVAGTSPKANESLQK